MVNENQLLFPKDDLKIIESKYLMKDILFFKIKILVSKYINIMICDFKNKIIALFGNVFA